MTAAAPVLMNRIYRHQRHVYDLTRAYYLLGRDRLIDGLNAGPGERVLEIGCGTGRNLVCAAQKYPDARFYGIDVSTEMLATARRSISRAGLSARLQVAVADATATSPRDLFGTDAFEHVFVSYTLSMIPDWTAAIDAALRALAPGGELQIIDFGDQRDLPASFRSCLRHWLALFHVTPRDDLEDALARRAATRGAHLSVARPYRGYAQHMVLRLSGSSRLD
jgi:S-adenosylmethionine-diacylgycerolhomoserine-N-methlytransferase